GSEVDGRADLYSLGVVLFELLTGRRPFEGSNVQHLLHAHADKEPPTFAQLGFAAEMIPPGVEEVVRFCLAKQPDARPPRAAELATRYEQGLGKRLRAPSRTGPSLRNLLNGGSSPGTPSTTAAAATKPPASQSSAAVRTVDRHAVQHSVEA